MARGDDDFVAFARDSSGRLQHAAYLLTGDRHDAEDLLQTALARTCVRWSAIRDKGAADAYVRTAMVHQARRGWSRRGREVVTEDLPDAGHDDLAVRADHLALWAEVRRLPPRMRTVVVLRFFEDLSVAETAREMGCSEGAVKSQSHHALKRLRAALPALDLAEETR